MFLATRYYGFSNGSMGVFLYAKGHPLRHDRYFCENKTLGKMEFRSIALYKVL